LLLLLVVIHLLSGCPSFGIGSHVCLFEWISFFDSLTFEFDFYGLFRQQFFLQLRSFDNWFGLLLSLLNFPFLSLFDLIFHIILYSFLNEKSKCDECCLPRAEVFLGYYLVICIDCYKFSLKEFFLPVLLLRSINSQVDLNRRCDECYWPRIEDFLYPFLIVRKDYGVYFVLLFCCMFQVTSAIGPACSTILNLRVKELCAIIFFNFLYGVFFRFLILGIEFLCFYLRQVSKKLDSEY